MTTLTAGDEKHEDASKPLWTTLLPIGLVVLAILLSPFMYDLYSWLRQLMGAR